MSIHAVKTREKSTWNSQRGFNGHFQISNHSLPKSVHIGRQRARSEHTKCLSPCYRGEHTHKNLRRLQPGKLLIYVPGYYTIHIPLRGDSIKGDGQFNVTQKCITYYRDQRSIVQSGIDSIWDDHLAGEHHKDPVHSMHEVRITTESCKWIKGKTANHRMSQFVFGLNMVRFIHSRTRIYLMDHQRERKRERVIAERCAYQIFQRLWLHSSIIHRLNKIKYRTLQNQQFE